jgi:hypothetical protein
MRETSFNSVIEADADVENISTDKTLDGEDVGKVFKVTADAKTITLPATTLGYTYTIVNWMNDGECKVTISPNASDKIIGIDITSADDKDLINTKATAQKGDKVTLFGDGDLGWYVMNAVGTWARES